ncbi:hypothetical protein BGV72_28630 [Burkholderia ubonensis]|uniref:hypothetical protein n=1 Tax=Burkholderia ubonensis TaxID=101571 RepID=UPI00091650F6|nr:hypothetical protein [Burkholderia ubonensis]OJA72709.1 hypothetical protein BGV72_28630 [Burkholderia ubonensis]
MKRSRQQVIPVTDDPKKAAAWARTEAERDRQWRERAEPMRQMVEAILGKASDEAPEPDKT